MAKETVICDTDVIIDYWNVYSSRHSATYEIIENFIGTDNIIISAITKIELLMGAKDKEDLSRINKKIRQFQIILIDNVITETAIKLIQDYRLSHSLELADALIAATSKISDLELFTYNVRDYKFIKDFNLFQFGLL